MLITSVTALMMAAAAAPNRRGADCVALPIPMAFHGAAEGRRDPRLRGVRYGQGGGLPMRCFRLAAR